MSAVLVKATYGIYLVRTATTHFYDTPNVDDLSKVFESTPGRLIVPNPNLGPETNWSKEISAGYFGKRWTFDNVIYHSHLYNFITLAPATLDGR